MKTQPIDSFLLCLFLPIFIACSSASADCCAVAGESTSVASQDELGQRFLSALQDDDLEQFQACWLQAAAIEHPQQMGDYLAERDAVIRAIFPILRRALGAQFEDLNDLWLLRVLANDPSIGGGNVRVGSFDVVLAASDGRTVQYRIDDGLLFEGSWLFTDKPDAEIILSDQNGLWLPLRLAEYATQDELPELQRLGLT